MIWRDQVFPWTSTPVKPKVWVAGAARLRSTTVAVTVLLAGIAGEGKYCANVCAVPSIVKPVTRAGTPEISRKVRVVVQLKPCASGDDGHTVSGAATTIPAAPTGTTTWIFCVAPPPLKAESPEYCATNVNVPVAPNR